MATLLEAFPASGRTHQIRVHLKALGHPIMGDRIYSSKKQIRWTSQYLGLTRTFLHSQKLTILHPGSTSWVSFTAPLPRDLQTVLELLSLSLAGED